MTLIWRVIGVGLAATCTAAVAAQTPSRWAASAGNQYPNDHVHPNVVYRAVGDWSGRLDLYVPATSKTPVPVVIFFHGGGLLGPQAKKEARLGSLLPWLEMGYAVVNVEYRDGVLAKAPGMVEDSRCALRWVVDHAREHGFDTARIITTGESMGSWLALLTGMMPSSAGLDGCGGAPLPRAAAIIDWFGFTDIVGAAKGSGVPLTKILVDWLAGPRLDELAAKVSPLSYVNSLTPPIVIIHGDADPSVNYRHAIALDDALAREHVEHEFVTVPGGGHGHFSEEQQVHAWAVVTAFLRRHRLMPTQEAARP